MLTDQSSSIISTYTADVSGVCSALFELGGMTVMHDASGCNSTYNTHDEPRWYDMDSLVFLSGLTEMEAVMGDDEKLISDILETAKLFSPKFIAIAGTPIPMMIGTDFEALAKVIEEKSGIPTFGFPTNGMHSYIFGADMAFRAIAERFVEKVPKTPHMSVNIIGTTPLDFAEYNLDKTVSDGGFEIVSRFGIGGKICDIEKAGGAWVNIVASSCGLSAAQLMYEKLGIPYVVGTDDCKSLIDTLQKTAEDGACRNAYKRIDSDTIIIGEAVSSLSKEVGTVISPPDTQKHFNTENFCGENALRERLKFAKRIIADPLFKPICPSTAEFVSNPHHAFSGRIYTNLRKKEF